MRRYGLKGILYLMMAMSVVRTGISDIDILALLIPIIATCGLSLNTDRRIRIGLFALISILSIPIPLLILSFPLIAFDFDSPVDFVFLVPLLLKPNFNALIIFGSSCLIYALGSLEYNNDVLTTKLEAFNDQQRTLELSQEQMQVQAIKEHDDQLKVERLNERNRIARDIHDNVGHLLSSAIIQVGALQAINTDAHKDPVYATLKQTLDQGMDSIRSSVHALYNESIQFEEEVATYLEILKEKDVNLDIHIQELDPKLQNTLLLILKEAVNNIVKHSNATAVKVSIKETRAHVIVTIHDNGTLQSAHMSSGIGLKGIQKRIKDLNGVCNIQTHDGYRIYINVPKEIV
ncbi:hypothetical protein G7062_04610 [Erysipelothrix sp. HDW6C]|uniref:sensor histidine kinase n=1 Tax=Erysipelothrix sp. HDW6C TaxID=2714930 RepID=UPI00140829FC|nr:histidine kinase [Erysipelothrix sp. HDW6C]QIK69622.1 hypothetical protein G7062_04610 [Erysipelothrix sp. HDW6C]